MWMLNPQNLLGRERERIAIIIKIHPGDGRLGRVLFLKLQGSPSTPVLHHAPFATTATATPPGVTAASCSDWLPSRPLHKSVNRLPCEHGTGGYQAGRTCFAPPLAEEEEPPWHLHVIGSDSPRGLWVPDFPHHALAPGSPAPRILTDAVHSRSRLR